MGTQPLDPHSPTARLGAPRPALGLLVCRGLSPGTISPLTSAPWQRAAHALHLSRICRDISVMSWGADGVQRTPNKESAGMGFPQPVASFFPPLLCRPAAPYLLMGGEASPRSKGRRSQCVQGPLLDSGASPSTSLPPPAGAPCLAGGH